MSNGSRGQESRVLCVAEQNDRAEAKEEVEVEAEIKEEAAS